MPPTKLVRSTAKSSQHDCRICGDIIVEGGDVVVYLEREAEDDRYVWYPYRWYHETCHRKREVKNAL